LVLFLPFTPGNSILKSFNALPLRRTTWHCCHSLLGFACSHTALAGPCCLLLSRCLGIHSCGLLSIPIGLPRTFGLLVCSVQQSQWLLFATPQFIQVSGQQLCVGIYSRGSCCRLFQLPRTLIVRSTHSGSPCGVCCHTAVHSRGLLSIPIGLHELFYHNIVLSGNNRTISSCGFAIYHRPQLRSIMVG
jgi:hypothetical protein